MRVACPERGLPGCCPGRDRAHGTAREVRRRKRHKSGGKSHGNNARPAETAERTTAGTAAGQDGNSGGSNSRENGRRQITAKNPGAALTILEAAFAKNFNNKACYQIATKFTNPVTNKTQNEPPKAGLSATRRRKEKNPADTGCKKSPVVNNLTINLYICDIVFKNPTNPKQDMDKTNVTGVAGCRDPLFRRLGRRPCSLRARFFSDTSALLGNGISTFPTTPLKSARRRVPWRAYRDSRFTSAATGN